MEVIYTCFFGLEHGSMHSFLRSKSATRPSKSFSKETLHSDSELCSLAMSTMIVEDSVRVQILRMWTVATVLRRRSTSPCSVSNDKSWPTWYSLKERHGKKKQRWCCGPYYADEDGWQLSETETKQSGKNDHLMTLSSCRRLEREWNQRFSVKIFDWSKHPRSRDSSVTPIAAKSTYSQTFLRNLLPFGSLALVYRMVLYPAPFRLVLYLCPKMSQFQVYGSLHTRRKVHFILRFSTKYNKKLLPVSF